VPPAQLPLLSLYPFAAAAAAAAVMLLASGDSHLLLLTSCGSVWGLGSSTYGQVGAGGGPASAGSSGSSLQVQEATAAPLAAAPPAPATAAAAADGGSCRVAEPVLLLGPGSLSSCQEAVQQVGEGGVDQVDDSCGCEEDVSGWLSS
jgi:hypothetical protein